MHPKTKEIYERYNLPVPLNANDIVTTEFFEQTIPESRKIKVNSLRRIAHEGISGNQWLTWHETEYGSTLEGNLRNLPRDLGKYSEPVPVKEADASGRIRYTGKISRWIDRYEKEFNEANVKEVLARNTSKDFPEQRIGFAVDLGWRSYAINSLQDFLLPLDKLIKKLPGAAEQQQGY